MKILWSTKSLKDFSYWEKHDPEIVERIWLLLEDIKRSPFSGLGKPEPLKGEFHGAWSRRITKEHRLIYEISGHKPNGIVTVLQCRYHYAD